MLALQRRLHLSKIHSFWVALSYKRVLSSGPLYNVHIYSNRESESVRLLFFFAFFVTIIELNNMHFTYSALFIHLKKKGEIRFLMFYEVHIAYNAGFVQVTYVNRASKFNQQIHSRVFHSWSRTTLFCGKREGIPVQ